MRTKDRFRAPARALSLSLLTGLLLTGCISGGGGDAGTAANVPLTVATSSLTNSITKLVNAAPFSLAVSGGNGGALSYASDNTAVATVSSSGVVTVIATGTATLTVTEAAHAGFAAQSVQITLSVVQPQVEHVVSNGWAFAALRADGSVVTWGDPALGGDSSAVASELDGSQPVVRVVGHDDGAFAAIRANGSVVTWGDSYFGGDSSTVASALDGTLEVVEVFRIGASFAALRADGSVVTWGGSTPDSGSISVMNGTPPVVDMVSSSYDAYVGVRGDGSLLFGGGVGGSSVMPSVSGDPGIVDLGLSPPRVLEVFATTEAFALLYEDGSAESWGSWVWGGNDGPVQAELGGTIPVTTIVSNFGSFAALRSDGSVVTWGGGSYSFGGDSSSVAGAIDGTVPVKQLFSTWPDAWYGAYAALRIDGSVVTWGAAAYGGDSSLVAGALDGSVPVVHIASTGSAFAALRTDGSVVAWGNSTEGGDISSVSSQLDGSQPVVWIVGGGSAFAALRADGSVVTWGSSADGGDSSSLSSALDGSQPVLSISANERAFAALRADGSVVTWGDAAYGGDSSSVAHLLTDGEPLPLEDTDADGISNGDEWATCTLPFATDVASLGGFPCLSAGDRDTDGDGLWDDFERFHLTNPLKASYQERMGDLDLNGDPDFWIQPSL